MVVRSGIEIRLVEKRRRPGAVRIKVEGAAEPGDANASVPLRLVEKVLPEVFPEATGGSTVPSVGRRPS